MLWTISIRCIKIVETVSRFQGASRVHQLAVMETLAKDAPIEADNDKTKHVDGLVTAFREIPEIPMVPLSWVQLLSVISFAATRSQQPSHIVVNVPHHNSACCSGPEKRC